MSLRCNAPGVLYISFNQDCTCLCVAGEAGVKIFNVEGPTPACVFNLDTGAISVAEMLFCTSLLAFVGAGEHPSLSPRKLTLFNTHSNIVIQNLSMPSSVLAVLLNRKRLVAILERRAFMYNLETLELLRTLDTHPNTKGLGALTVCSEPCLLALPAASDAGIIRVYDALREGGSEVLCELPAHKSPLGLLSWNDDGTLLASASQKGTVVRVHAMPSAVTTHSLRRGTSTAAICSLAFTSPLVHPQLLCVASDHSTVHVFRLQPPERHRAAAAAASLLAAVMPARVSQAVEPARPLLMLRLPVHGVPCICAVQQQPQEASPGQEGPAAEQEGRERGDGALDSLELAVASAEGMLYHYTVEGLKGSAPKYFLQGEWRLTAERS